MSIAKRKARRKHFLSRLKSRFFDQNGKPLFDDNDPAIIKQMIVNKQYTFIRVQAENQILKIFYKGVNLPVVYDPIYKQLVTVLPANAVK